jgi:aldose 1-epimerase
MEQRASNQSGFQIGQGEWQAEPVVILSDRTSGSEARIAYGIGANCIGWSVTKNQQVYEILETPLSPPDLKSGKFKAGIPILWPFPGRVRDARYRFEGKEYKLPVTDKGGVHHIHGVLIKAAWKIASQGTGPEGSYVDLRITPEDLDEDMRAGYPFDFALTLRLTLAGPSLTYTLRVDNRSADQPLPFGYGLHPYFRAPLAVSNLTPDRSHCEVRIPAAKRWPATGGLPDGAPEPVSPEDDFQEWRPLGASHFDHMYSDIKFEGDWSVAGYRDPGAGLQVLVKADHLCHDWVLFTQPNRPSICIEPYSCPPNAINFEEENLSDSHLLVVAPGQSWQGQVIFEVSEYQGI